MAAPALKRSKRCHDFDKVIELADTLIDPPDTPTEIEYYDSDPTSWPDAQIEIIVNFKPPAVKPDLSLEWMNIPAAAPLEEGELVDEVEVTDGKIEDEE